jgi:Xaa-Pro aminopeptidase
MTWLTTAQTELQQQNLAGWLIYDFRGTNPVFKRFVKLPGMFTRRVFLFVPAQGKPVLLVHAIELSSVTTLPFEIRSYSSRQSLETQLKALVTEGKIALETSPMNDIPYVSHVDAGTVDMLRSLGADIVSSANLLQVFSTWTTQQLEWHLTAVKHTLHAKDLAFAFIRDQTKANNEVREAQVQKVMSDYFDEQGLLYDHPAIVGFAGNAGNPHYIPQAGSDRALQRGDVILVDVWSKINDVDAPYADITWMGCFGEPSDELQNVWETVRDARDVAVRVMQEAYDARRIPQGAEVDRAVRAHISAKGYGEFFTHRTGHSIGNVYTHGDAVHLDDFETNDTRELRPGIAVTVEPGVYLKHLGVRSEINVYLEESGPRLTTEAQKELIVIS